MTKIMIMINVPVSFGGLATIMMIMSASTAAVATAGATAGSTAATTMMATAAAT
jgi:hypothetical protein